MRTEENTKQTKNNETNENIRLFVCFVIFRLFRVSLHLSQNYERSPGMIAGLPAEVI
jgi:hypothetical protein